MVGVLVFEAFRFGITAYSTYRLHCHVRQLLDLVRPLPLGDEIVIVIPTF